MKCQCCGDGERWRLCEDVTLPGIGERLCFRCWKWYMLLFVGQTRASDKWVRDSKEG